MLSVKKILNPFLLIFSIFFFSLNTKAQEAPECYLDRDSAAWEAYYLVIINPALELLYSAQEEIRSGCDSFDQYANGQIESIYRSIDIFRETGDCSMFRFLSISLSEFQDNLDDCEAERQRQELEEQERQRQEYEDSLQRDYDQLQQAVESHNLNRTVLANWVEGHEILARLESSSSISSSDFTVNQLSEFLRELEEKRNEVYQLQEGREYIERRVGEVVMYSEGEFDWTSGPRISDLMDRIETAYSDVSNLIYELEEEQRHQDEQSNQMTEEEKRALAQKILADSKVQIQNMKQNYVSERKAQVQTAKAANRSLRKNAVTKMREIFAQAKARAKAIRAAAKGKDRATRRAANLQARNLIKAARAEALAHKKAEFAKAKKIILDLRNSLKEKARQFKQSVSELKSQAKQQAEDVLNS